MIHQFRKSVLNYLESDQLFPSIIAIASGLYPMIYIYSRNFSLVNSKEHLLFFIGTFLLLPILVFKFTNWLLKKLNREKHCLFAMTILNVFTFLFLIKTITYGGPQRKKTVLVFIIALFFALFLKNYLKRLVLLQYLLVFIGLFTLLPNIYTNLSISNSWQNQPDDILKVQFKKKPNVYMIQPDGYTNFSELDKGFYNYNNSEFESYLTDNDFVHYANYRSNYPTTLSSNSSFFMMKHHYYNNRISDFELYNARDMIVSENPVLGIFKSNGYKTHFITQTGYMLFNRPKMGYDYCNFDYGDFPFINPGISEPKDISKDLKSVISNTSKQPKFVFIEMLKPWHIKSRKQSSRKKAIERKQWLKNLKEANAMLTSIIELIKKYDSNALIVIAADHGGYVGFDYAREADTMTHDRDLIYSIFSSQLSIRWPENKTPQFKAQFKTSVNLFRQLFVYLSENETYLEHLQPDVSYKVLREGINDGIYEYIDTNGNITLKSH